MSNVSGGTFAGLKLSSAGAGGAAGVFVAAGPASEDQDAGLDAVGKLGAGGLFLAEEEGEKLRGCLVVRVEIAIEGVGTLRHPVYRGGTSPSV